MPRSQITTRPKPTPKRRSPAASPTRSRAKKHRQPAATARSARSSAKKTAKKAPKKKASAKKTPAKKPAKKTPKKKASAKKKTPTKKASAKKKTPTKKASAKKTPKRTVSKAANTSAGRRPTKKKAAKKAAAKGSAKTAAKKARRASTRPAMAPAAKTTPTANIAAGATPKQLPLAHTRRSNRGKTFQPEVYTDQEMLALLSVSNVKVFDGHRARTMIALMWRTGIRTCEAVTIRLSDLMLDRRRPALRIVWGKKRNQRSVGLDADLVEELRSWLRMRAKYLKQAAVDPTDLSGKVFPSKYGKPIRGNVFRRCLEYIDRLSRIGKRLHAHGFRHTFANNCIQRRMRLDELRYLMGHRDLQYTQRYIKDLTAQPSAIEALCSAESWRSTLPRVSR